MAVKICFVGIHNKPGKAPLCSSMKTGKIIDRIINEVGPGFEFKKANLFHTGYLPKEEERQAYADMFEIRSDTLYIGLGAIVNEYLSVPAQGAFWPVYHPSFIIRRGRVDEYVNHVKSLILSRTLGKL